MKRDGRVCVITGGASGIGLEIATGFAAAGGKAFTTVEDMAHRALFLATFAGHALTGRSIMVRHGWRMD